MNNGHSDKNGHFGIFSNQNDRLLIDALNNGHFGVNFRKRSFWLTGILVTVILVKNYGHFGYTTVILVLNNSHFYNHPPNPNLDLTLSLIWNNCLKYTFTKNRTLINALIVCFQSKIIYCLPNDDLWRS